VTSTAAKLSPLLVTSTTGAPTRFGVSSTPGTRGSTPGRTTLAGRSCGAVSQRRPSSRPGSASARGCNRERAQGGRRAARLRALYRHGASLPTARRVGDGTSMSRLLPSLRQARARSSRTEAKRDSRTPRTGNWAGDLDLGADAEVIQLGRRLAIVRWDSMCVEARRHYPTAAPQPCWVAVDMRNGPEGVPSATPEDLRYALTALKRFA